MRNMLIGMLAVATLGACARHDAKPTEHDTTLLKDRLWIDHVPRNDKDIVQAFAMLSSDKSPGRNGPIGVFHAGSQWTGGFEAFRYEANGEEVRALFPQTGARETIIAKPSRCNENRFEFCLDVSGSSHGVKRYYSRKGFEIRSVDEAESLAASLAK